MSNAFFHNAAETSGIFRTTSKFPFFVFSFLISHFSLQSTFASPSFSRMDTLFITAATGEPRFQAARDSAESVLRAEGAGALNWLVDTATARAHHPLGWLFRAPA